jgi:hypothetical protein
MAHIPETIVGHTAQQSQLMADIAHQNVTHAYLFSGSRHLGKFSLARWFAWRLLADGKTLAQAEETKLQVERLIHPDILSLDALWIEGRCEDWSVIGESSNIRQHHRSKAPMAKTDTIGIEDLASVTVRLFETGTGTHLCCLIRSIDRMSTEAANAFLKVLEEPPKRVVFLLTTENEHDVLPTVLSRTRVLRFHPLSDADLKPFLDGTPSEDAAFALLLARGAPGTLKTLLQDPDLLREKRQFHGQARLFWQNSSLDERLRWLLPFSESKKDWPELLLHLGLTLREHPDPSLRPSFVRAYSDLNRALHTNAHRALLLERFALAVTGAKC